MKYSIVLLLSFLVSTTMWSQNDCSECDKFKIVGVYDFGPPPGGNWIILLLTVTEDIESHFDPHYSTMYFVNRDSDTITVPLGNSYTLPTTTSDTIPFLLELATLKSNQNFPNDFQGHLVIRTPTGGICGTVAECHLKLNLLTSDKNLVGNKSSQILLFPNPGNSVINIRSDKTIKSVEIFDESGKVCLRGGPINGAIDISDLLNGLYLVRMEYIDGMMGSALFTKCE